MTPQERFEQLLQSSDSDFERQRLDFFADPEAVAYLPKRFNDPDRVTAFIARQLHLWATNPPPEFANVDRFLETGIHENKEAMNRTAAGWIPAKHLQSYVSSMKNRDIAIEFLLLKALFIQSQRDSHVNSSLLNFYMAPSPDYPMEDQFFTALDEPEALIRVALEFPGDEVVKDQVLQGLIEDNLPQLSAVRAIQAIEHELRYATRKGGHFPQALIEYRNQLRRARR